MKRIYQKEILNLKKGDILHYISYNDSYHKTIFFDAFIQFKEIKRSGIGTIAICKILVLNSCEGEWGTENCNFYTDINPGEDVVVYYIGPGEKFPEYFI